MSYAKVKKFRSTHKGRIQTPWKKRPPLKVKVYHLTDQGRAAMEQGFKDTPRWKARLLGWRLWLLSDCLLLEATREVTQMAPRAMIEKAVDEMLRPNGAKKGDYRVEVLR